jgi:PEP-CTERM motif
MRAYSPRATSPVIMKNLLLTIIATLALATLPAKANTYTDATGELTGGVPIDLDISSVTVNNDATTLTFTINVAGNPMNQTWYDYLVGISKNSLPGGGNQNATGGWGMDLQMSVGGMDYLIGSYPGFAGYDLKTWNGSGWNQSTGAASENSTSVTIPIALSTLGLSAGDSFTFDVWTQSSGNNVLDALSDGTSRTWNNNPFDTGANALSYTVVPEPATWTLLGLGALVFIRHAIRRSV